MDYSTYKLGWKPDLPDNRDFDFSRLPIIQKVLPASVDLRPKCSAVEDQAPLGSCVFNATVGNMEFLLLKDKKPFVDLSRLFPYYTTREYDGCIDRDDGATLRTGIKMLAQWGVCTEKIWPYVPSQFKTKPSAQAYADAAKRKVTTYARINGLLDMKRCLADGYPFVFGFTVYSNFTTEKMARTGRLDMPGPTDIVQGGHAVMAVGYSNASNRFIIRNSWGTDWGMKGYFTMPYEYVASGGRVSCDHWTIRAGINL